MSKSNRKCQSCCRSHSVRSASMFVILSFDVVVVPLFRVQHESSRITARATGSTFEAPFCLSIYLSISPEQKLLLLLLLLWSCVTSSAFAASGTGTDCTHAAQPHNARSHIQRSVMTHAHTYAADCHDMGSSAQWLWGSARWVWGSAPVQRRCGLWLD